MTSRKRQHVEELLRQRNIDNLRRLEELGREKQRLYNDIRAIFREDLLNEMDQLLNIKAENHSRVVDTRGRIHDKERSKSLLPDVLVRTSAMT